MEPQAAKSQVCDPGGLTRWGAAYVICTLSVADSSPFPSQSHLDSKKGKRQDAPCQLPNSADSQVLMYSHGHSNSSCREMTEWGRQGENKRAVNFHPNPHTHMHIHRTNSNHPKPLAFFFFFLFGPFYNVTTQLVTHHIVKH